ncbi:MAG: hypothetical protein EXS00_07820 [Phycisphaerales bacterium]|nr:hypothetical protein [Phycisphaerales bacterium]
MKGNSLATRLPIEVTPPARGSQRHRYGRVECELSLIQRHGDGNAAREPVAVVVVEIVGIADMQ